MLILGAITTVLMLYYAVYLWRSAWAYGQCLRNLPQLVEGLSFPMVSVIIPARNESKNIAACVVSILAQDYPEDRFEVILINDHSEDDTVVKAKRAAKPWNNFRVINMAKVQGKSFRGIAFKKAAVATGIDQAHGEIIVTTDGDCIVGERWLKNMVGYFGPDTGMVSGPVVLESDSLFMHLQALEFMGLNAVGAAAIQEGKPTMCNGANLAYRKSAFKEVGGFAGIDHIASGDDELLMHKIAAETNWKVAFAADQGAIVRTDALRSWAGFKAQRIRWVSKSTEYKRSSITATLVISWLAMAAFPVLLVTGLFAPEAFYFLLGNLLLKIAGEFPILFRSATFFDKLHLLRFFLPEQICHIGYVLWVGLAGNSKSYTWKGREVK